MPATQTAGAIRKFVTRTMAAGSLLAMYAVGTVVTTGAMLTATTTAADAQYYRGYRGYRGYRAIAGIAAIEGMAGTAVWCAATATTAAGAFATGAGRSFTSISTSVQPDRQVQSGCIAV